MEPLKGSRKVARQTNFYMRGNYHVQDDDR